MFNTNSYCASNLSEVLKKKGIVKGLRARNFLKNISKARVVIECSLGNRNNFFQVFGC